MLREGIAGEQPIIVFFLLCRMKQTNAPRSQVRSNNAEDAVMVRSNIISALTLLIMLNGCATQPQTVLCENGNCRTVARSETFTLVNMNGSAAKKIVSFENGKPQNIKKYDSSGKLIAEYEFNRSGQVTKITKFN